MTSWDECYKSAIKGIEHFKSDLLFYRGHANHTWKLLPSLARVTVPDRDFSENACFFDFETRSGDLMPVNTTPWELAFTMQHHGIPTRLLDWTESFSTALYFSLLNSTDDACVWILDPFKLNRDMINRGELVRPQDLKGDYDDYFISKSEKLENKCVAVSPLRRHPRVFKQRAGFTIHDDLNVPLDEICPDALFRVEIPLSAQKEARLFLELSGVSDFHLFPDLDGLARELLAEHFT